MVPVLEFYQSLISYDFCLMISKPDPFMFFNLIHQLALSPCNFSKNIPVSDFLTNTKAMRSWRDSLTTLVKSVYILSSFEISMINKIIRKRRLCLPSDFAMGFKERREYPHQIGVRKTFTASSRKGLMLILSLH